MRSTASQWLQGGTGGTSDPWGPLALPATPTPGFMSPPGHPHWGPAIPCSSHSTLPSAPAQGSERALRTRQDAVAHSWHKCLEAEGLQAQVDVHRVGQTAHDECQ